MVVLGGVAVSYERGATAARLVNRRGTFPHIHSGRMRSIHAEAFTPS